MLLDGAGRETKQEHGTNRFSRSGGPPSLKITRADTGTRDGA